MTTLDFSDSEPALTKSQMKNANTFSGNAAFYERLQGRKKTPMQRYGWVALPIAAVAIIGVVAATSTPHSSADDVVGAPGQVTTAANTPAPGVKITQASADDVTPASVDSPAAIRAKIDAAPAAQAPSSAPAPVKLAKRAPAPVRSDAVTTAPASATATTRVVEPPVPAPAPAAAPTEVNPPAASVAPAAEAPVIPAAPPAAAPEAAAPAQ
jgi:hypothetical protein